MEKMEKGHAKRSHMGAVQSGSSKERSKGSHMKEKTPTKASPSALANHASAERPPLMHPSQPGVNEQQQ